MSVEVFVAGAISKCAVALPVTFVQDSFAVTVTDAVPALTLSE